MIDEEMFIQLYRSGARLEDIAIELNVTLHIVKSYANSLSLRFARKYREEDLKQLEVVGRKPQVDIKYAEDEDFEVRMRAQKFLTKASLLYSNLYTYNLETFLHSKLDMVIYCREHGKFEQSPNTHLEGTGCPICLAVKLAKGVVIQPKSTFKKYYDIPTTLYYVKVTDEATDTTVFKVGITTKPSVIERFKGDSSVIVEVLNERRYDTGEEAYRIEQGILSKYKEFKYEGQPILKGGNSELFTKDIFGS